jgi:membrane-associated phospholipid phosphatase
VRTLVCSPNHHRATSTTSTWACGATWLSASSTLIAFLHSAELSACERAAPWSRLGTAAGNVIEPLPLALVGGAFTAPLLMAPTGVDHELRLISQRSLGGKPNLEPVSVWTPFVLPVLLMATDAVAHAAGSCEIARPTSAMLQAMGLTLVTAVGLKWVTGRSWPNAGRDPSAPDRLEHPEFARTFHWFSWSQGSAWPSGHTATMAAAATALTTVTYGRSWLGYVTIAAASGVAVGMWLGDHHWGSDIVSGGLLGVAFGYSVGMAFRDVPQQPGTVTYMLLPWRTPEITGLRLAAAW